MRPDLKVPDIYYGGKNKPFLRDYGLDYPDNVSERKS